MEELFCSLLILCRSPTLQDCVPQDGMPSFGSSHLLIKIHTIKNRKSSSRFSIILHTDRACRPFKA